LLEALDQIVHNIAEDDFISGVVQTMRMVASATRIGKGYGRFKLAIQLRILSQYYQHQSERPSYPWWWLARDVIRRIRMVVEVSGRRAGLEQAF
jgi:hypothetical protein